MKNRPIYENLDTSFANLSALIKYLRRRQFVGDVRVELSGYDADIGLTAENQLNVREHDRITGRTGEGEEALQRILIRAREPGGIIHVYQKVEESETSVIEKSTPPINVNAVNDLPIQQTEKSVQNQPISSAKPIVQENLPVVENKLKSGLKLPKFPFELSNKVEAKARQTELSSGEWQTLLDLTTEIILTVDKTLAEANLDFPSAFERARLEISADYPFMNPASGIFNYQNEKISMTQQVSSTLFIASVNESLRRIFEKLGGNQKFAEIYKAVSQNILALIRQRKPLYDRFFITPSLQKILGV